MPPAIEVTDLRKSYGDVEAVRGLSFAVERGEVYGLLGPNGAGKTTTVEILEGYRSRTAGEVRVLGHDPAERDRRFQEQVGIVLQSCGFYPRVTVREAVEHFAKAYPRPRDPGETIALVGLEEKADARTKDLGKTVLLTTHYLDEAQALADRVAIVKDGRIVAEGPPDQLVPGSSRYRVSYVSDGRRVEHQTDDPTELLHRLTRDALARDERLEGLEVTRPTLEAVYLELTHE